MYIDLLPGSSHPCVSGIVYHRELWSKHHGWTQSAVVLVAIHPRQEFLVEMRLRNHEPAKEGKDEEEAEGALSEN
jgi:hypothetical protein